MTLTLLRRAHPLASAESQRTALAAVPTTQTFAQSLASAGLSPLRARSLEVLQINVGKLCNQTCRHCHVDAGPDRRESMSREVLDACLRVLETARIPLLDITGGAPEMHPQFREAVTRARALGRRVMDRCNLTILETPGFEDLAEFLASSGVEIVCSLPYYMPKQTDLQRGEGVFERSIAALQRLNALGYGREGSPLKLTLVTNPVGAFLPANQAALERDWKRELRRRYGVEFHALYTITNMPISRFLEFLAESGNLESYMERLVQAFNPAAAANVMCRTTLSVGWDGTLYDCDFNQMLDLPVVRNDGCTPREKWSILQFEQAALAQREIAVGPHCYGCTAGAGSSCGGATA